MRSESRKLRRKSGLLLRCSSVWAEFETKWFSILTIQIVFKFHSGLLATNGWIQVLLEARGFGGDLKVNILN